MKKLMSVFGLFGSAAVLAFAGERDKLGENNSYHWSDLWESTSRYDENGYHLQTGTFYIDNTIVLNEDESLVGKGAKTIINVLPTANPAIILGKYSKVKNLTLVGTGATNSVGISTDGSQYWGVDSVKVSKFQDNILVRNSVGGILRDITSVEGGVGVHFRGTVTATKMEGLNCIRVNNWGIVIDNIGWPRSWGHAHLTLALSGVIEGNSEGGLLYDAEEFVLTVRDSHFETNGPQGLGPNIYLKGGVLAVLGIHENGFLVGDRDIVMNCTVRTGEISCNHLSGAHPITTTTNAAGVNIHDNRMPAGTVQTVPPWYD